MTTWIGKIIGAIFGFVILGPLGILLGLFVGHLFDRQFSNMLGHGQNQAEIQAAFFEAVFLCMGHLAKKDGRVSENEISAARQIMANMQLSEAQTLRAMELFTEGKSLPSADFALEKFKSLTGRNKNLFRMFLQFQFQAAYADGQPQEVVLAYLRHMGAKLGLTQFEFETVLRIFQAQYSFYQQRAQYNNFYDAFTQRQNYQGYQGYQQYQGAYGPSPTSRLKDAFGLLGVAESATKEEVKKAYRRQMNEYHPDKLVAKGMPESMMKAATEKTQAIKEAYELINQAKGW